MNRRITTRQAIAGFVLTGAIAALGLAIATALALRPVPETFAELTGGGHSPAYVDRRGERLHASFDDRWNLHDTIALHEVPALLRVAFIAAEDRRFHRHGGVDWRARAAAVMANLRAGRVVRGASTISEQVVRMLHPRPRTPWARWLEGFEAAALERRHTKAAILEFYLNQVPYAARRRGIVQAARYYFDRDLHTCNEKELIALAVIVRAPRWFDPVSRTRELDQAIRRVADRLQTDGQFDPGRVSLSQQEFSRRSERRPAEVRHVLRFARSRDATGSPAQVVHTTLDLTLQRTLQRIVDRRLDDLETRRVYNAALLAVDHASNEIRAWVVGNAGRADKPGTAIDAVTARRQPGSALKPLLYTEALDRGWTAATILDDTPLEQSVGLGLHAYRNYSQRYYGPVSLREALGNSLNIPAVRAIQFVGPATFLTRLRELGIENLDGHPNRYGDGLALGNGEVTLFELVQAYTVLGRMGEFAPLSVLSRNRDEHAAYRVYSGAASSVIADILSDPGAREKEFGRHSILNFATPTAVKTGTSSDYRDAWAVGYDDRYTVGVWMGNLDYEPMDEITGSTGPALVLRAALRELNRHRDDREPLYRSPELVLTRVCTATGLPPEAPCDTRDEWLVRGAEPAAPAPGSIPPRLRKPVNGLRLAMDPRIPDSHEYFQFELAGADAARAVHWYVNGERIGTTARTTFLWPLERGSFRAHAEIHFADAPVPLVTPAVAYHVN